MKTENSSSRTVRNSYDEVYSELGEQIQKVLEEPIMKAFLEEPDNVKLLNNVIEFPTELNCNELDEAFRYYYQKARMMKYLITLIRIYSIDYDKKHRKLSERFPLIVDKPLGDEEEGETLGSLLAVEHPNFEEMYVNHNAHDLGDYVTSTMLYYAIDVLTEKQRSVIKLFYVDNLL
ncbi:hypothetical protein GCM10008986_35030 [Salinibacillus aidingensis]|uniref:Uncharacterized protein n=1 Tax=Salinibacillus aidingensis TaxID=237684 RepID=A0ABN1BU62_9BACI